MIEHKKRILSCIKTSKKKGSGLINTLINKVPIELHLPGYQFCGPGTHLEKRLRKGETGINPLDTACREHDIAYSQSSDLSKRHEADKVLEDKAWQRVKAKDASFGEKLSALAVTGVMKGKRKLGMGIKKKKKRVLKPPKKIGGFLPLLLPILGALGALGGGTASIVQAINDVKASKEQLEELHRHNKAIENLSSTGKGLYIKPYKGGSITKKKKSRVSKKSSNKF